ncbi:MAG: NAD(P)/FAD-dependent oxidoreductase [Asticcacaulis sp.]|uniref:NAD(P)/FAD-dependent oxidoreductase n=1 Tax=Asticcacaulis sp. TaxID=1872648 RepID=UPI0025BE9120|nr:NAD(P)/FAD-dependent oxidoreductase [Asticcacaulis sp.]MCA1935693.1 NAD(P)/FAD-dependent oxidoreductase [Asticcacaulis sp.]
MTAAFPSFTNSSDDGAFEAIVIGGGPAGCACALWLHKLGVRALLVEASDALGGLQRRSPYENLWIPGLMGHTGEEVAGALHRHVHAIGVPCQLNSRVSRIEAADGGFRLRVEGEAVRGHYGTQHLVIATGTQPVRGHFQPAHNVAVGPGYPMENLEVRNCKIAILGGGDNAFDQARFVLQRGAKSVTIFSRTPPRAQPGLQALIPEAKVRIGPYTADQARMTINGEVFDAFGVMYGFAAQLPDGLPQDLELKNENGFIAVNRQGETVVSGLWACGEVTDYWHPCVTTSAAHGIQVAKQISLCLGR